MAVISPRLQGLLYFNPISLHGLQSKPPPSVIWST